MLVNLLCWALLPLRPCGEPFQERLDRLQQIGFWGSFGTVGCLVSAGICLLDLFFSSDKEDQQQALIASINGLQTNLLMFRREVHERFDHIDAAISQLARYAQQMMSNQQALFEQNKRHIELSLQGFRAVAGMLNNMHAENRSFQKRIHSQFAYLIGLTEIKELQTLKEDFQDRIHFISAKYKRLTSNASELSLTLAGETLVNKMLELEANLIKACSPHYNGQKEFRFLQNNTQESLGFLARRLVNQDDALGFLR